MTLCYAPSFSRSSFILPNDQNLYNIFFGSEIEPFRYIFFIAFTTSWTASAAATVACSRWDRSTKVDVHFRSTSPNVRNIAVFNEIRMNNIIIFYGVAKRYGRALHRFLRLCVRCAYHIENLYCIFRALCVCVFFLMMCSHLPYILCMYANTFCDSYLMCTVHTHTHSVYLHGSSIKNNEPKKKEKWKI